MGIGQGHRGLLFVLLLTTVWFRACRFSSLHKESVSGALRCGGVFWLAGLVPQNRSSALLRDGGVDWLVVSYDCRGVEHTHGVVTRAGHKTAEPVV